MDNYTSPGGAPRFLTAFFKNPLDAEKAYTELMKKGYKEKDITFLMSDETKEKYFSNNPSAEEAGATKALEGMGVGGAIGSTVGAIAAAVAAVGTSLIIPGLGLVIAGPLAAAFAGAGAGAAAGGLVGTLIGAGIPDGDAKEYEKGIKEGGVVIGVTPLTADDSTELRKEWDKYQR